MNRCMQNNATKPNNRKKNIANQTRENSTCQNQKRTLKKTTIFKMKLRGYGEEENSRANKKID